MYKNSAPKVYNKFEAGIWVQKTTDYAESASALPVESWVEIYIQAEKILSSSRSRAHIVVDVNADNERPRTRAMLGSDA